jgi:ProP effector
MNRNSPTTVTASIIALLVERFPAAFVMFERRRRPLAIGTYAVIREIIREDEIESSALKLALRTYCGNNWYLRALAAPGAMRINLNGEPIGPVEAEQAAGAATRIAARIAHQVAKAATTKAAAKAARKTGMGSPSAPIASPPAAAPAFTEVSTSGSDRSPRTSLSGLREAARQRRVSA